LLLCIVQLSKDLKTMKRLLFLFFFLFSLSSIAQVLRSGGDYVPNQIVVKLKDEFSLKSAVLLQNKTAVSNAFDNFLLKNNVKELSRVFSENGNMAMEAKKMNLKLKFENTLIVTFKNELSDVYKSIEELKKMTEVEYAEPNYYYGVDHTLREPRLAEINETKETADKIAASNTYAIVPSDPLFSQQQNIQLANLQKAWEITKGDSVVIGVLDTGVDWEHPDLQGNIWMNYKELSGKPGVDDDNNGYIDDIRGWDWINNDNNPTDDNSHGTHVAGIIAARGDNGIGITGVNWFGKIMCLKVMQSTGRGDAVTIARGVEYAAAMGAKVLNLSLGGYYESLALKSSLEKAYAKCFIVAAAGNDGKCIGPGSGCAPLFPGATSFVLGVQDRPAYSNFDEDGPFDSKYADLLNYDVYAPGSSILSTVPKGAYRTYTGTSMSTPFVAGVASLYMSNNKTYDKEFLFGHLINTSSSYIDAYKFLTELGKPNLTISKYELIDTCSGCNNDGKPDAGENVNIRIYVKNTWAKADSVSFKIEYEPLADKSLVKFVSDSSYIGSVSSNATTFSLSGNNLRISDNVYHGAEYKLNVKFKDNKGNSWADQLILTFQNAVTFGGILSSDYTLKPNKLYFVTENLIVDNCKLTILPGSILNFSAYKAISTSRNGVISAIGKPDSVITFKANVGWTGINTNGNYFGSKIIEWADTAKNVSIFKYCHFDNLQDNWSTGGLTERSQIKGGVYLRCSFKNSRFWNSQLISNSNTTFYQCNFINNRILTNGESGNSDFSNQINNFIYYPTWTINDYNLVSGTANDEKKMNVFNNQFYDLFSGFNSSIKEITKTKYFGTDDSLQLSRQLMDYFDNSNYTPIIIKGFKTMPVDTCPGIVWKVELDGKLLNSYSGKTEDIIEPGIHELKVFFSRAMNISIKPTISFGQRLPFNQVIFSPNGKWSSDSLRYTITREFTITDPKGVVNFDISGAIDNIGMEIPFERNRFRINLQSAGSKSLNFGLQSLCGKIGLDWENLRKAGSDIIGYNLYRRKNLGNNTYSTFSLLNKELVLENRFIDYKVNLDTTYQYVYTAVRAGMNNETDSSFIVAGMPLASKLADANGDSSVNVLDVVAGVNYILQKEPAPFVFKQTDINNDGIINVLDIIGIIDRILNPRVGFVESTSKYDFNTTMDEGEVYIYKLGDTLYARSNTLISGIQSEGPVPLKWIGNTSTWERIQTGSSNIGWMVYGFGKSIDVNRDKPIALVKNNVDPSKWLFSSSSGRPIKVNWVGDAPNAIKPFNANVQVSKVYPNPSNGKFRIAFKFNDNISGFTAQVFDKSGKLIQQNNLGTRTPGMFIEEFDIHYLSSGSYSIKFIWFDPQGSKEMLKQFIKQ
jgi:subtilisin family serine protease